MSPFSVSCVTFFVVSSKMSYSSAKTSRGLHGRILRLKAKFLHFSTFLTFFHFSFFIFSHFSFCHSFHFSFFSGIYFFISFIFFEFSCLFIFISFSVIFFHFLSCFFLFVLFLFFLFFFFFVGRSKSVFFGSLNFVTISLNILSKISIFRPVSGGTPSTFLIFLFLDLYQGLTKDVSSVVGAPWRCGVFTT